VTSCHILESAGYGKRAPPILANSLRNPLSLGGVVNRIILPSLNRCEACGKAESNHQIAGHPYKRNNSIPEWHGWHAARRGLGRNLYRLGVPEMVIQRILRHANVSTTATSYIKTAADDGRKGMTTLGNRLAEPDVTQQDTIGTPSGDQDVEPSTVQ
jgi:integrase